MICESCESANGVVVSRGCIRYGLIVVECGPGVRPYRGSWAMLVWSGLPCVQVGGVAALWLGGLRRGLGKWWKSMCANVCPTVVRQEFTAMYLCLRAMFVAAKLMGKFPFGRVLPARSLC